MIPVMDLEAIDISYNQWMRACIRIVSQLLKEFSLQPSFLVLLESNRVEILAQKTSNRLLKKDHSSIGLKRMSFLGIDGIRNFKQRQLR